MSLPVVIAPGDVGHIGHHEEIDTLLGLIDGQSAFLAAGIAKGLLSARPAAGAGNDRLTYFAQDVPALSFSDGSQWYKQILDATANSFTAINNFDDDVFFGSGSPWVDVRNELYGAVADGVTDDTVAIQDAATAAAGGIVFAPVGTYLVDGAAVTLADNTTLKGIPGSTIFRCSRGTGANFQGIVTNADHVGGNDSITVDGIVFDRTVEVGIGSFDEHIYFQFVSNPKIIRCRFSSVVTQVNHSGKQVLLNGCTYGLIAANTFEDCPDSSLTVAADTGAFTGWHRVLANRFRNKASDFASLFIVTQDHATVTGNIFEGDNDPTLLKSGNGKTINWIECGQHLPSNIAHVVIIGNDVALCDSSFHGVQSVTVAANTFDTASIYVTSLDGGVAERNHDVRIMGNDVAGGGRIQASWTDECDITNNKVSGAIQHDGIAVTECSRPTVANNRTWGCGHHGISVSNCGGLLVVASNTSYDNSATTTNTYNGISVDAATVTLTDAVVAHNVCFDSRTGGSKTQAIGLTINKGTRYLLVNNVLTGNATAAFQESNSPTYAFRSGNIFDGVLDRASVGIVATASITPGNTTKDGTVFIEDTGAGANLVVYARGAHYRIGLVAF